MRHEVRVTLHNGRLRHRCRTTGAVCPWMMHPTMGVSGAEVIFTVLHAGGKFNQRELRAIPAVCTAWARRSSTR